MALKLACWVSAQLTAAAQGPGIQAALFAGSTCMGRAGSPVGEDTAGSHGGSRTSSEHESLLAVLSAQDWPWGLGQQLWALSSTSMPSPPYASCGYEGAVCSLRDSSLILQALVPGSPMGPDLLQVPTAPVPCSPQAPELCSCAISSCGRVPLPGGAL